MHDERRTAGVIQSVSHPIPIEKDPPQTFDRNGSTDLTRYSSTLSLLMTQFRLRWWHIALIAFGVYYCIPLFAAASCGALIAPSVARIQFGALGLPSLGRFVSRDSGVKLFYLADYVHFAMSAMVLVGSAILLYALTEFDQIVSELRSHLSAGDDSIAQEFAAARVFYRGYVWRLGLLLISLLLAFAIERRTHAPSLSLWWGHASHGPAGHLMAFAVWAMVFWGGSWLLLLATGIASLSRLLKKPLRLQPFHPDGCNGFAKLGNYLMTLLLLSIVIAATAWLCLHRGYLGVEKLAITWLAGASGIIAIPIILITPLVRCTIGISKARLQRLDAVRRPLEEELEKIEHEAATEHHSTKLAERVQSLRETRAAAASLYPSNIFPFKGKVAGTLSATYVLQVALFLKEAYTKLFF
jgi:hypothetical protein